VSSNIFQDPTTGAWYSGPARGDAFGTDEEDRLREQGIVRDPDSGDFYQVPRSSIPNWRKPEPIAAPQAPEPTVEDGVGLADYARSVMAGGAQIGQSVGWLMKELGAEDIGGAIENLGRDAVDYWNEGLSNAAKDALSREFVRKNEGGEWEWGDANLHTVGLFGAQSLLGTVAGAGAGAGITKVLQTFANPVGRAALLRAAQAGTRAETAIAGGETSASVVQAAERGQQALKKLALVDKVIGTAGFASGEGLVGGASAGVNVYDRVMSMDPSKLTENPRYRQVYESTDDAMPELERHQYAAETVAREASTLAGLQSGLTTALLGAPMGAFFGSMFGKATVGKLAQSRMARAATGAAGEAAQEFAQGAAEQAIGNVQVRDAGDTDVSVWDDVLNQALGGALAGAPMGGVMGAAEHEPMPNLPTIEEMQRKVPPPQEMLALPAPKAEADFTVGPNGEAIPRGQTRPEPLALPAPRESDTFQVGPTGEARRLTEAEARQNADQAAAMAGEKRQRETEMGTGPTRVPGPAAKAWSQDTIQRIKTTATEAVQAGASRETVLGIVRSAAKGETPPLVAMRQIRQVQTEAVQSKALPAPRPANAFEVSSTGEARQLTEAEARQANERVAAAEQAKVELGTAPTKAPGLGGKRGQIVQKAWTDESVKRVRTAADTAVEAGVPREVADGVLVRMAKGEIPPIQAARQLKQLERAHSQTIEAPATQQGATTETQTEVVSRADTVDNGKRGTSVQQVRNPAQPVEGSRENQAGELLPGVPRGIYAGTSAKTPRATGAGAVQGQRPSTGQGVQGEGPAGAATVREVRGAGEPDASRRLQPAVGSAVDVPAVPSDGALPAEDDGRRVKPRLAENAEDLRATIVKQSEEGVPTDNGIMYPVVRVPGMSGNFRITSKGVQQISDDGRTVKAAATADAAAVESAVERDEAQVVLRTRWGGSGGSKTTVSKDYQELHSPAGNQFAKKPLLSRGDQTQQRIGLLPRGMREELFGIHRKFNNPDAKQEDFNLERVPRRKLRVDNIEGLEDVAPAELEKYGDPTKLPPVVIADGRLVDGRHRIARAKQQGVSELDAIDMTGLIDTNEAGYITELPERQEAVPTAKEIPEQTLTEADQPPAGTADSTQKITIGQEFNAEGRKWRVISYRHTGESFEASTVDGKAPFVTKRFPGADPKALRRQGSKPETTANAARVQAELKNFSDTIAPLVNVQVHETVADLQAVTGFAIPETTKGAWMPGSNTVHIVAGNHAPGEAIKTAVHEVFGHLAMERYPEGQRAIESVTRQIQQHAPWAGKYVLEVTRTHGNLTDQELAKEVIALMAERGEKNLTMAKLMTGIRRFLRKLGVTLEYSDADIRDLIARSARALKREAIQPRAKLAALTPASTDQQILDAIEEQFPSSVVALDTYMELRAAREKATGEQAAQLDAEIARLEGKQPEGDNTLHLKKPLRSASWTIELDRVRYPVQDANGRAVAETPEQQRNFWRWFRGSKLVDARGRPLVLYHGTTADIHEFDNDKVVAGFHFGTPSQAGMRVAGESGRNLMPTYLHVENPRRSKDTGGKWAGKIKSAKAAGHDAIVYLNRYEGIPQEAFQRAVEQIAKERNSNPDYVRLDELSDEDFRRYVPEAADSYIVFRPEQIKSAIGNRGTFDPSSPNILFRRGAAAADPKVQEILDRVMVKPPEAMTMRDKARELWHKITDTSALELKQGFIDSFASIEALERNANDGALKDAAESAYKAALATKNLSSVMAGVMLKGVPEFKNGAYQPVPGRKGIIDIFDPLTKHKDGNLLSQWEGYAAARRASRLIKEKNIDGSSRENLFTQAEIDTLLTLGEKYPEFGRVFDEWQGFNKQVLDLAQEAGVVDPETRVLWERNDYVPFYRVAEELGDKSKGPSTGGGLANQKSGIRQLKGGEAQLGNVFENMMMNTAHLIDASFKNHAMQRIVELGTDTAMNKVDLDWEAVKFNDAQLAGALRKAGIEVDSMDKAQREHWSTLFRRIAPKGPNIVSVMVNGKPEYYEVTDPLVLQAIAGLGYDNFADVFGLFRGSKKLLTHAITADPAFMLANFVRDTLSNWVISDASTKPMVDAVKALGATLKDDPDLVQLMMAGAGGGGFYDSAPEDIRKLIASRVPENQQRVFLDSVVGPKNVWRLWRKIGAAAENANRIATFRSVLAAGGSVAEAAYQARDVMNFSMAGNFGAMRWLTQSVPFLNARIQGLYRLYRGARDNKRAFFTKGLMLTAATMALALSNEDDDRYEELPEWDKDTYWHLFLGDEHYRIPKPFEIGALFSTIPERFYRAAAGRDSTSILADRMFQMFSDTFAFNPVPQLVKPIIEQYANRSMFTGSPIVGMAEQPLQPEAQFTPWTSETMQELAKAMPDFAPAWLRSPKRLEAALRAYTGAIGMYILGASDQVVRTALGYPPEPGRKIYDLPIVSRFWKDPDPRHTKYADELYKMMDEANAVSSTVNRYTRERRFEEAAELRAANKDKLAVRLRLNRLGTQVRNINNQIRLIQLDERMDPATKRARIDALVDRKNDTTREVARYSDIF
jgi:hypothetical protein